MPAFQDLTGQKFGHLTAVRYCGEGKWVWECDCGKQKSILAASVKRGITQSCGRECKYSPSRAISNDLTGKRFGRLIVIKRADRYYTNSGKRCTYWECKCDCGNQTIVTANHLTSGHTWSCGCAHKEQMEAWKTYRLTHGRTKGKKPDRAYRAWEQIKHRCYNPKDINYKNYGAKGITMWEGWINDPTSFCEYVSALDRYAEDGVTIDRIDFQGNYEPGNLRWLSLAEQQRNKSSNVWITANGETHVISEWSRMTGLSHGTISYRLKSGWTHDQVINTPRLCKGNPHPVHTSKKESMSMKADADAGA